MLEELFGYDRTDRVAPAIAQIGSTVTVPEPSGQRIGAATLQITTQHITWHVPIIAGCLLGLLPVQQQHR